jgi:hypothetical protein
MKLSFSKLGTLLLPFLFLQSTAHGQVQDLIAQNQRVLSGRIHKILESRLTGLNSCPANIQSDLETEFKNLPVYSDQREIVLKTLNLYLRSYVAVPIGCQKALNEAEQKFHQQERQKFSSIENVMTRFCKVTESETSVQTERACKLKIQQVFAELDPHCVSRQVPNASNTYDPFPCLAADYLVGKSLVNDKTWKSFLSLNQGFLINLREALNQPEARTNGVDLLQVYLQDNPDRPDLRENFLAEIDFYLSSFHSASSYIRGFHDHIWSFVLFKTNSAEQALDYFMTSRLIVDQYRTLNRWAEKMHIEFNIHGIEMKKKNRHDYMAAYLACHYRRENRLIRESLPILLGYAYESFDFKSHMIDDHDSFKAAKENFVTDTTRYRTGTYWGYQFCEMKF